MNFKVFKNYGVWVSILSLIPLVLETLGIKTILSNYPKIIVLFLSICVGLGIISNPTNNNRWCFKEQIEKEFNKIKGIEEEEEE